MLTLKNTFLTILLITVLFSLLVSKKTSGPFGFKKDHYLIVNCTVYNDKKEIVRTSPLMGCLYFKDGKVFGKKNKSIVMIDKNGKKLWEKDIIYHSVGNKLADESGIIFLSSEEKVYKGQLVRFDFLIKMDLNGNVLNTWKVSGNLDEIKKIFSISEIEFWNENNELFKARKQFPHANSVYEIPTNELANTNPAFRKGNFIVSLHGTIRAFIVLSSDLKKILWHSSRKYHVHDVQVLSNGNILLHNNRDPDHFYSQIQEIDPSSESVTWSYNAKTPSGFFSTVAGSVQKLDEKSYLYSTNGPIPHVAIISKDGKMQWYINLTPTNGGKIHIMNAKLLDLGDYFNNNL